MMKSFSFAVALLVARTSPVSASPCTGSTPDWMDADGYGCEWYEAYDTPGCPRYGNLYGGEMGVANGNCCYCEGTGVSRHFLLYTFYSSHASFDIISFPLSLAQHSR